MIIGSMKLIKKESPTNKCVSDRFSLLDKNLKGCLNRESLNTTIKGNGTLSIDNYNWLSEGSYKIYDDSGISVDINLTYPDFYTQIDSLINSDWINENTYYVISIINFYSKNLNKIIIFRNTYELVSNNFIQKTYIKISDIENKFDIWYVLAIVFSVFCLIFEFLDLKKPKRSEGIIEVQTCFKSFKNYFVTNFKRPSLFTLISN